jgi:hypothetical protein
MTAKWFIACTLLVPVVLRLAGEWIVRRWKL